MEKIRSLLGQLPKPLSRLHFRSFSLGKFTVETYRVKKIGSAGTWESAALKKILTIARGSSRIYGNRPLYDELDKKAAIYIARVVYPPFEEWLSYRLVPPAQEPIGAGELEMFRYRERPDSAPLEVSDLVREKLGKIDIFATSRMCGIHPLRTESGDERIARHRFSAFCYQAISYHMYQDYLKPLGIKYTSGIILNQFVTNTLHASINGTLVGALFTPATVTLGLRPESIKVNRKEYGEYVYGFPGYWLNFKELLSELSVKIHSGILSENCVRHYLGLRKDFTKILLQDIPTMKLMKIFSRLGNLLTATGKLKYCTDMTGELLRERIDWNVEDGPELKITETEAIQRDVLKFFGAATLGPIH